jgi:hypothetical protein
LFVEEFFQKFRVLIINIFYFVLFEPALFLIFDFNRWCG